MGPSRNPSKNPGGPSGESTTTAEESPARAPCACGRPATGYDARRGEPTCCLCARTRPDGGVTVCEQCGNRVATRLVEDGLCPACEGDDGPDPRLATDGAGDWYETETLSNPDGSMDVHYCWECGHMMADETVEEVDACPSCGYSDDGVES